jgi:Protein of unknown function (DUF3048) N-terminal domain/Protein of unknown function (DUF3048) C-terminal domain
LAQTVPRPRRSLRRPLITTIAVAIAVLAVVVTAQIGTLAPGGAVASTTSPAPSSVGLPSSEPAMTLGPPTATPAPPTVPPPTPVPLVAAPLTGRLVPIEVAERHPIAVMVDDHAGARPQAGLNAASVVWHAPAEGGVPRYMLIYQDQIPGLVGPIRSARQYYVEWAAELNAMYVHHGGSPQALETLARRGNGTWVFNADGFRWEGRHLYRVSDRFAPHNVMTDGKELRKLAKRLKAADAPIEPAWSFGPDAPPDERPTGGSIKVVYPYETVTYRYDPIRNRYLRYIDGSKKAQVDAADGEVVAPANVVILRMFFGPLNDGHPEAHRLEARNVGKGEAWIASNGVTVKGTWRKASPTAPTRLFGPDGKEITLTVGQTFVQVLALTYNFTIKDGTLAGGSPSAAPRASSTAPGSSSP